MYILQNFLNRVLYTICKCHAWFFFFLRRKGNYIKVQFLQKDPETKPEIQRRPLDPDEEDELDAAGGAPPPLHPLMAWIRCSPSADGKSPVASS
jgi:hypothetical protein